MPQTSGRLTANLIINYMMKQQREPISSAPLF
jgi:hypothetical protein